MTTTQPTKKVSRAPIVAVMGHIDHGKSTLLDYIRKANTAAGEVGGITQHVAAYEAKHTDENGAAHSITFIDTPGHAAFSAIRARGAALADIAILVVAGDDGVKPQTLEAYKVIREYETPFIVAITKSDLPATDVEKVKRDLLEHEIYVEGMGGDIPLVSVSAKTGTGIEELLSLILLVAEMAEITCDQDIPARGTVIESNIDKRRGISATLIITEGTLECGSHIVAGGVHTPVRIMHNYAGEVVQEAHCGQPVCLFGWGGVPVVGESFFALTTKKEAEARIAETEAARSSAREAHERFPDGTVIIPIVLKADVVGSLEALKKELVACQSEKVKIRFVGEGIGPVSEADIKAVTGLGSALVIGFNVPVDTVARHLAEREAVPIETFDIIYRASEWLTAEITRRTPKELVEEVTGSARILKCFSVVHDKQVLGARLLEGALSLGSGVRIIRRGNIIGTGTIRELQQQKAAIKKITDVESEFGVMVESKRELAPNDTIEAVETVEK